MQEEKRFFRTVCTLAIPAALQSLLQSSFSLVDQIMIGQLGAVSVAAVGLAGKFASIYAVVIAAIGAVAGIMISQYLGQDAPAEVRRSFFTNLWLGFGLAGAFTALCLLCPGAIMRAYTADAQTLQTAADYLRLLAGTYLPMAGATMLAAAFRCAEKPRLPRYAGIASALLNTVLNDLLIFGKCGFAAMGATGAGIATVLSQWVNFLLMLLFCRKTPPLPAADGRRTPPVRGRGRQYLAMLLPLLICEVTWSLGENVYAAIYGRMGTDASAAMTLTAPVQGLVIGALCGLSQAAGVIVGKRLGSGDEDAAYAAGKRLLVYGAAGAALLSVLVVLLSGVYVEIYQVEDGVKRLTRQILTAYALVAPCKVLNMILGGGILRSGGRTAYVMAIDLVGTWGFGVPAGLVTAFVFALPVPYVYFALSLEECLRFGISLAVFRRRRWMRRLSAHAD